MKRTVTIYDIAKESGVSVSTVSRVLNNSPNVSPRTLERVKEIIGKYDYSPSTLARAMTINQTHMLGVVMPDISNPYFSMLFLEIQRHALENDYSILLFNTLYGGSSHGVSSPVSEPQYFRTIMDNKVDGVIVTGGELDKETVSDGYISALNRLNDALPVVAIAQKVEGCECLFLSRNLGGGIPSLVQHLAALGNRRIGFIGGESGVRQTTARLSAFQKAMESLRLSVEPELIALSDYYTKDGYSAMNQLLESGADLPDAVVAINDAVAVGAIRCINDRGLRCPEDIAVISGDQFFESDYMTPRLTSLDQRHEYLGNFAIMTLLGAIGGVREQVQIEHEPRLIIRESCGSKITRF